MATVDFNSQDSICPTDSITNIGDKTLTTLSEIELAILDEYLPSKNCLSRSLFTKVHTNGIDKWKCKVCPDEKTYKYCSNTTANIRNHSQITHPNLWKLLNRKKESGTTSAGSSGMGQQKISKYLGSFTQESFEKLLVKFAVTSDQSFLLMNHPGFVDLINHLNENAKVPSRKKLKSMVISQYEKYRLLLKSQLSSIKKLSFTTDVWTSQSMKSFVAVTYHYLDDNFELQSGLLDFTLLRGKHSGIALAEMFLEIISDMGITNEQVIAIVCDNASNNDAMVDCLIKERILQSGESHIRCFAHILNLAAKDFLKPIDNVVQQVRLFCKFIRASPQRLESLETFCKAFGVPFVKPELDVATRWNSTFLMLKSALRLKQPITSMSSEYKGTVIEGDELVGITDNDWKIAEKVMVFNF